MGGKRLEGVHQNNPRTDSGSEVLAVDRAQRLVLPRLDVAGRPIVQEDHTKEVVWCVLDPDDVSHVRVGAHEAAQLKLEVKLAAGSQDRLFDLGAVVLQDLAVWTLDRCTTNNHTRSSSMISNRQVHVVWLQGVLGSAEEGTHVVSMVEAGVEVGVVTNLHGHVVLALVQWNESFLAQLPVSLEYLWERTSLEQHTLQVLSHDRVELTSEGGESVQSWLIENLLIRLDGGQGREAIAFSKGLQIECIVANGNGRVRLLVFFSGDDAEGDVVNGEMRLRINVHPGFERRHWKAPSMGRQSGGGGGVNGLELLSAACCSCVW